MSQRFMRDGVWKSFDQIKKKPEVEVVVPVVAGEFVCDVCQRVCKSKLGLISHLRTHKLP